MGLLSPRSFRLFGLTLGKDGLPPLRTFNAQGLGVKGWIQPGLALTVVVVDNLANLWRQQKHRGHIQPGQQAIANITRGPHGIGGDDTTDERNCEGTNLDDDFQEDAALFAQEENQIGRRHVEEEHLGGKGKEQDSNGYCHAAPSRKRRVDGMLYKIGSRDSAWHMVHHHVSGSVFNVVAICYTTKIPGARQNSSRSM